jgi:xanthine/uracil permease
MKDWIPQIVIGLIVTVVGTLLANAVVGGGGGGHGRHFISGVHFGGSRR